jgi:site-specific DNA-methyltransferase (adenine-specific)
LACRSYIFDKIFRSKNFRNDIVWRYRRWAGKSNNFQKLHGIIFFYSKTDDHEFDVLYTECSVNRKRGGLLRRFKAEGKPIIASDKETGEKRVLEGDV